MAILQMLFLILSVLITRGFAEPSAFSSAQTDTTRTTMTSASSNVTTTNDDIIYQNRTLDDKEMEEKKEETPSTANLRVHEPITLHLQENWVPDPIHLSGDRIEYDPFLQRTIFNLAALKPLLGIPGGAAPRPAVVDPVLTPAMTPNSRPGCSFDFSPCRYDESYPRDKVNLIVDRFYNDITLMYKELHHVSPQDLVYYDNRTHGYRSGGHFVCESRIQYIRPGWARNVHGRLQAILNTDKFPQIIKVERCQYEGRRCEYLPPCYKSSCIQRTSYVKLVALDPEFSSQKPSVEVFEVPTACSCFVEDFTFF